MAAAGGEPLLLVQQAVEALAELLGGAGTSTLQGAKQTVLLETLSSRATALEATLEDPQWGPLRSLRAEVVAKQAWWLPLSPDSPGIFTAQALILLLCLKQSMALLAAAGGPPQPIPKTAEAAPALSPDSLSISQERTVRAALQLIITLGLCPYLLPGVGVPLRHRTEFSALIQDGVSADCLSGAMRKLYATCIVLLQLAQHPSLGNLIFTRHLGDLLAGLCQLGFCPAARKTGGQAQPPREPMALTEEELSRCRAALQELVDRVYQPLVVQELLMLQGGSKQSSCSGGQHRGESRLAQAPAWLRRVCGQLLSERLIRPGGVHAVVRGIVEGGRAAAAAEATGDWQKCDVVARILSTCPQQSRSLEDYCQQVCPQILQLLLLQDKLTAHQFQRVATSTIVAMARQHPEQAEKHLLRPLLEPLLRCLAVTKVSPEDLSAGTVLVEEEELSRCVDSVFKVYVVGNEALPGLRSALQPVLGAIFALYCFTKQNVSFLRTPCQEILQWFLENSERETALSVLEGLAGLGGATHFLHLRCHFQPGSEGGAVIAVKDTVSDEEEVLYQKVSSEHWQLEQLAALLSTCQSSGLAGAFFLRCLKELTGVAGQGASRVASVPLSCDRPQERQLRVLQLMAVLLCESHVATFFTDVSQVVEFVAATLQRACATLACGPEGTVEAQTMSMAMGLVAAVLGGAVQLKGTDFAVLKQLVPLLEEVSRVHPEPVIQDLATDLSAAISTHGAFSTETLCSAAQSTLGKRGAAMANKAVTQAPTTERSQGGMRAPSVTLPQKPPADCTAANQARGCPARTLVGERGSGSQAHQDIQELLLLTCDPSIPTRAAALRSLSRLVQHRDPGALQVQEKVLKIFMENLQHRDSFVYLSAIQGIASLADVFPEQVLPCLLAQYGGAQPTVRENQSAETRMKVGEALMRVTRALGDLVFPYRESLIHAFLRGAKDPDGPLRASSLSNLGELCQTLGFQLGSVVHEVASGVAAIAKTDCEADVRRAAVHVVVLLLRGLSERAAEVLQDVLLDLYRMLKFIARCEQDAVTVLHAQMALEELDDIMRRVLFPHQTLEKKIMVLP